MNTFNKTTVYTVDGSTIYKFFFHGLSSERLSLTTTNGSRFVEVDTGKTYIYDADTNQWTEMATGGGGGGEPTQYLKSIVKDDENKTITITDKEGNTTTFEYGSGVSSLVILVDELPTEDIIDGVYYKLPDGTLNKHLNGEWYVSQVYQYEWSDNSTTLELHDSKEV